MSSTIIIDSITDPAPFTSYPGLEPAPTSPVLFTFPTTGQRVRVVQGPDGEPWFVARDVCAALDTDRKAAPMILDQDEHCTVIVSRVEIIPVGYAKIPAFSPNPACCERPEGL